MADSKHEFEQMAEAPNPSLPTRDSALGLPRGSVRFPLPTKFSRSFQPKSHWLELSRGFWDRIGQVRRRSDDLQGVAASTGSPLRVSPDPD